MYSVTTCSTLQKECMSIYNSYKCITVHIILKIIHMNNIHIFFKQYRLDWKFSWEKTAQTQSIHSKRWQRLVSFERHCVWPSVTLVCAVKIYFVSWVYQTRNWWSIHFHSQNNTLGKRPWPKITILCNQYHSCTIWFNPFRKLFFMGSVKIMPHEYKDKNGSFNFSHNREFCNTWLRKITDIFRLVW